MYFCENSDFEIYTDLALERRKSDVSCPEISFCKEKFIAGKWEKIEVTGDSGARQIGKPIGFYETMITERFDLIDEASIDVIKDELAEKMRIIIKKIDADATRILVVGLGNATLTPDSLGSLTADRVKPTMHIKSLDRETFSALGCSEISVIKPGVGCQSGLDAKQTVKGVCDQITPSVVIAVDALAARAPERLGTTVQLSSTGIIPGSGLGHARSAIDEISLGTPVVSVGVPTVMDARYFINGDIKRDGRRSAMFISPKEIDEIVLVGSDIIADGINRAFGLG